mgnify:CR=1 FL=1
MKVQGKALRQDCLFILKGLWFLITCPIRLLIWLFSTIPKRESYVEEVTEEDDECEDVKDLSEALECPEFMQYFTKSDEIGIGLEYIEMCPDETAVLRIVGETTFSKQYRRRIYTDKRGEKFFKLNGEQYYIRQSKAKPVAPTQEKPKKP